MTVLLRAERTMYRSPIGRYGRPWRRTKFVSAVVEEQPDNVQEALRIATAALYFHESHKWEGKFRSIIRALSPELDRVIDERDVKAAYYVAHGEDGTDG